MKWSALAAWLALACAPVHAASYIDQIDAARPAAAALLEQTAAEWTAAPQTVKDAAGFALFRGKFPRKRELSQDDLVACMNAEAGKSSAETAVVTLFRACAGL